MLTVAAQQSMLLQDFQDMAGKKLGEAERFIKKSLYTLYP